MRAVLRASTLSKLPLLEQLPRTPAEWQPALIGSHAMDGWLDLSYSEAAACCDAMHAVRGVHTLSVGGGSGASEHPGELETGERACTAASSLSTLRSLSLVLESSGGDAVPHCLAQALPRLTQLEALALRWGTHDSAIVQELARPLGLCTSLTRLHLDIATGRESARGLAASLTCLCQLADLALRGSRGDGAAALAQHAGSVTTLTSLDLHRVRMDAGSATDFARGLRHLSQLAALDLSGTCIALDGVVALGHLAGPRPPRRANESRRQ